MAVIGAKEIKMGLPKAIQAQIEQADEIVRQLNDGATGETSETQTEPTEVVTPLPQPQEPIQEVPQAQPVQAQADITEETWERKYHTLQGMYNAEVPRLHQQVKELSASIRHLIEENAQLKAQPKPAAQAEPEVSLITDSDEETFGSDLINLADRVAKQNLAKEAAERKRLEAELAELRAQLGSVNSHMKVSVEDKFFADLTKLVPDWEAINVDQGFLNWLGEIDPIYGVPRQSALDAVMQVYDAGRMASIFNTYKTVAGLNKQVKAPRDDLQSQVAPTRSRHNPAPAAAQGNDKIWTQAQISAFYNEKRRGYMDDAEAVRLEREIEQAVAEGRVR